MVSPSRQNRKALLGKKVGMTQIFTEEGTRVPVTVIQAGPCTVLRVKTPEKDGYSAVQLGFDETKKPRKKPQQDELDRLGIPGHRFVREVPFVSPEDLMSSVASPPSEDSSSKPEAASDEPAEAEEVAADAEPQELAPGARVGVSALKDIGLVDIQGITKGRGFTGTIKRHGFSTGDHSHGSKNVREPGSTGMHTDPGRVLKGKKMAGQHGNAPRKARNISVVGIEEEDQLLIVKGAVPGPRGGYLYIQESLIS